MNSRRGPEDMGHRPELLGSETIAKHVMNVQNQLEISTYYLLDASGKSPWMNGRRRQAGELAPQLGGTMAVYEREVDAANASVTFTQEEKYIYGSTRLGALNDSIPLLGTQNDSYSQTSWIHTIGQRTYELSNHLGNVLSVISDKVIPHVATGTTVDYFLADLRQSTDYSPFGVQLSGRTLTKSVGGLRKTRFGYQGSEMDNEVKGDGNSYTTEFRQLDPRLGRWLSLDPKMGEMPWQSPYNSMDNNPITINDPQGLKGEPVGKSLPTAGTGVESSGTSQDFVRQPGGSSSMSGDGRMFTGTSIGAVREQITSKTETASVTIDELPIVGTTSNDFIPLEINNEWLYSEDFIGPLPEDATRISQEGLDMLNQLKSSISGDYQFPGVDFIYDPLMMKKGTAVTMPPKIFYGTMSTDDPYRLLNLFMHEYGHYLQYLLLCNSDDVMYYALIGEPSIESMAFDRDNHYRFYTEVSANKLAYEFFNQPWFWDQNTWPVPKK